MNVEIELISTLNKSQIELVYFNQRDNWLDKLTMKTEVHKHDNVQTTEVLLLFGYSMRVQ